MILAVTLLLAGLAEPGAKAPARDVPMKGVDGKEISIAQAAGAKGTLVIFTCNHCPYVKAWEERTVALGNDALARGLGVIAINANDPAVQPEDGYEAMQARAKERGIRYPYVVDADSSVAKAFGATRTPEFFLLDGTGAVVYHGALDDNSREPEKVTATWLKNAIDALLSGKTIDVKQTKALGCSIKWKKSA
jgi:peroxiredoxin